MSEKLLTISKCIEVNQGEAVFVFAGMFKGKKIKKIKAKFEKPIQPIKNEYYIAQLIDAENKKGILTGKIEKLKKLER